MDNRQFGNILLAFMRHFPGGAIEFHRQGGLISFVPFKDNSVFIYHPNVPKQFVDAVEQFNKCSTATIHLVDDINFENMSPSEVSDIILEVDQQISKKYGIPTILYNTLNPLVFTVTIPFAVLSMDTIADIAHMFSEKLPSIARGILIVGDEKFPFSSTHVFEVTADRDILHIEPERVNITNDSITDLKILLETGGDVMDIINKL